jgi:hypothetical protein
MDGMVSWEGGIAGAMELIAGGTCSNDAMDGRLSWEGRSAEGVLAIAGGGSAWRRRWFTGAPGERQNSAPSACGRLY